MPNRILKESVCTSITLDQLDADEERLFYRLMVQCDDFGRFYAHPGIVRGHCFPRKVDVTLEQMAVWLDSLERSGLIRRYVVDGEAYLLMVTWDKHQQVRAKRSKFPAPDSTLAPAAAEARTHEQADAGASSTDEHLKSIDINGNHLPANVPVIQSESNPILLRAAAQPTTNGGPIPKPKPKRTPITDAEIEDLIGKYTERYGTPQAVRDEVDLALNHSARLKNFNERLYVDGWLRRELERRPPVLSTVRNGRPAERERRIIDRTGLPPGQDQP